LNELALFAGAGGGILGGKLLGWRCVCAVECDAYAASVLVQRQNDSMLEAFPVWDDVRTFDGKPWCGIIDVVSGGFPCQDISCAGRGDGFDGERSGLWSEFARILGEVRPRYAFIENSPMLTLRGGVRVIADLAALGFSARWGVISAADAGAPHRRERIWIVADAGGGRLEVSMQPDGEEKRSERQASFGNHVNGFSADVADSDGAGQREQRWAEPDGEEHETAQCGSWWISEPDVGRVAHGVAARVDRLRCLGNGQVPGVAALAWRMLGGE
jgi:DNA (cytosine-5)-methyltransferase 1